MRFRLLISALFFLASYSPLLSQAFIKGKVTDRETGESLAGVYVIYGKGHGTLTGADGSYLVKTDSSSLVLKFQYTGYEPVTIRLNLNKGETRIIDAELHTSTRLLDQVVVSADRIGQKQSDVTVSVKIIKSDFLSGKNYTEAQELVARSAGVEILDGQVSIRGGSGFSYGVGSRVLALVDGLPLLSADAGSVRWQYLPLENLSQVEIIKGASSVLYGSSALNGIISFRTADASNIPVTKFHAESGMYLKPRNEKWKWWDSPRIFSTLSFSHLQKVGNNDLGVSMNLYDDNSYRKDNDELLGKLGLKLKHFSRRVAGLNYGANVSAGLTAKTDFLLWEDGDNALIQDTATVSHLHGRFLAIDPFISYSKSGFFRHDLRMRFQASENRFPVKTQNNAASSSLYGEYQLWLRLMDNLFLTGGASATWNNVNSNFFGDHSSLNLALFSQAEYRPFERLKIQAGVRIEENILDSDADRLVPVFRAGINYQAAGFTFLRASFGQGYRFPSIAEKYAATTLGSVAIFPNPFVKPESGWNCEAGVKQGIKLGELTGQIDLSLFYSRNKNLIEYVFGVYPGGFGFMADNLEQAGISGVEPELIFTREIGKTKLNLSCGYTYIYPVDRKATSLSGSKVFLKYRRTHSGNISASAERGRFSFDLTVTARSKMLNIDDVFISPLTREQILPGFYDYWLADNNGYITADAGAGYNVTDRLNITFVMKNATNTEYMGRPGDIQAPRSISLRLSGTF